MAESNVSPEYVGLALASLVPIAMYLKKFVNGWKTSSAEMSIVELMREELERMSAQNAALQVELNALQKEVLNLNKELQNLTLENQKLHAEVVTLTGEISRLQNFGRPKAE